MKNEQSGEKSISFKINNKLISKKVGNLLSIFHTKYILKNILASIFILLLIFLAKLFVLNQFNENNKRNNIKYRFRKKNLRILKANLINKLNNLYQSNLNNIYDDDHCEIGEEDKCFSCDYINA